MRSDARYFVRVAPATHQRRMQRGALKITDLERINRKMQVAVAMATLRIEAVRLFTDEMLIELASWSVVGVAKMLPLALPSPAWIQGFAFPRSGVTGGVPLRGASRKSTNPEAPHVVVSLCAGQLEIERHASGTRNKVRLAASERQSLFNGFSSLRVSGFCQASDALPCCSELTKCSSDPAGTRALHVDSRRTFQGALRTFRAGCGINGRLVGGLA